MPTDVAPRTKIRTQRTGNGRGAPRCRRSSDRWQSTSSTMTEGLDMKIRHFAAPLLAAVLLGSSGWSIAADSHTPTDSPQSGMPNKSMMHGQMMGDHIMGGGMMKDCPMMGQLPPRKRKARHADARRNDEGDGRHHAQVRRQDPDTTVEMTKRSSVEARWDRI
jgi:hypothetical protein